ncbi:MAG: S8 family peptidase [Bryobacteraceae bacterium]
MLHKLLNLAGLFVLTVPALHAQDAVPNELLVQFRAGATATDRGRALGRANARAIDHVLASSKRRDGKGDLVLVAHPANAQARQSIAADPAVEFVEPNWIYTHSATSSDPYFTNGTLWGMQGGYGSNAAAAWTRNATGSASVYVGVIDEGIQYNHPDLAGQVWVNPHDPPNGVDDDGNGYVDDVNGWDFANNDNTIYDGGSKGSLDNHGTHVSGTIGAKANTAGVVGVNWAVTLISGKFLGRNGGTTANAVKAVDYFTDLKTRHGLNIVATNNSWGGGGYSQALYDAIGRANTANILFVAAAGNGNRFGIGINLDSTPSYPASYNNANIIAVAAIDKTGKLASFSNYGASSVDIGAPGVSVISTVAGGKYDTYSGTSMATPHVTGAIALYAAQSGSTDAAAIKDAILSKAAATSSLSGKTVTGGRLDVNASVP